MFRIAILLVLSFAIAAASEALSFVLGIAPNVGTPGQSLQVTIKGVGFPTGLTSSQVNFGEGIAVSSLGSLRHEKQTIDGSVVTVDIVPASISVSGTAAVGGRVVKIGAALSFSTAVFTVLAGGSPGTPPPGMRFADAMSSPAPFGPNGISAQDLTMDGNPDLAVGAPGANTLLLYRGFGNGRFAVKKIRNDSAAPDVVAIADFNGDQKWDLVTGSRNQPSVEIWIGLGGINFKKPTHIAIPDSPWALTTGDFNGDGRVDVATVGRNANRAFLLLGNGNGTFQALKSFVVGDTPKAIVAGDLNKDGLDDAVVGNFSGGVSILKGNRTSGLTSQLRKPSPIAIENVLIADLNSDGNADVAVIGDDSILIYRGNGTGDFFMPPKRMKEGKYVWDLAAGDFNGDLIPDLAFVNAAAGMLSVLAGKGNLVFDRPITYEAGDVPQDMIVVDLNHDLKPDLVVTNSGESSNLSVFLNQTTPP
jgi:hypothetical protein